VGDDAMTADLTGTDAELEQAAGRFRRASRESDLVRGASVWIAPAGTPPPVAGKVHDDGTPCRVGCDECVPFDSIATRVGFMADGIRLTSPVQAEEVEYHAPPAYQWECKIAVAFDVPLELLGFRVLPDPAVPRGDAVMRYVTLPGVGTVPRKRDGITGRRYRAARRRYARQVRAWKRAGRPRHMEALVIRGARFEVAQ